MNIIVIDQSPELFWFVCNALMEDEVHLKHLQTLDAGEQNIFKELPKIVILNGDDKTLIPDKFISKMRNHVFARNTMFIVFTSDTSDEFKKSLLIAGAAQILYRGKGYSPSPKFFSNLVKWCLNSATPNPKLFEYRPSKFDAEAEFTSYGRIGWMSETHCMVETNLELNPGQSIAFHNSVFDELEIKDLKLECVEKNKVGRYYQYSNSLLCKILTKDPVKDTKKLEAWIQNNIEISKHKPIKLVYFEDDSDYREVIKQMIKTNKHYCARGYDSLLELPEILAYQMPHLVLINRAMIEKDKAKFEKIKDFMKNHFCYCVTYATSEGLDSEAFKKNFEFAMHMPATIDLPLLESMIKKLEEKLPDDLKSNNKKIYFNKHSIHSRISFHSHAKLNEIAINGGGMLLPYKISNFSACEISCPSFGVATINRTQFFRIFSSQSSAKGIYYQMIFMGQNVKDNKLVKEAIDKIDTVGYDRWLKGDFAEEK